jgi:ubiquinone biosynthesis protein
MTDEDDTIDPVRIVEEFTHAVTKEVDLGQELQSQKTFARNFEGQSTIRIPAVHEELCTDGVLVMDYIDGVKPTHPHAIVAAGGQPRDIAVIGADFILQQIFDHGFFHTDPHPGNLLVVDGSVLVPLDFGQVARLNSTDRELLAEVLLAIVNQDAERLVRAFRSADLLDERTNPRNLADELEEMLEVYYRLPLNEIPFGKMMSQTFDLIRRHHVKPPAEFTLMMKSMMTIECLAKALHSDFQLIEHLKPYARRITWQQYDPRRLMHKAGQTFRDLADLAEKLPQDVDAVLTKMRRGQVQMRVHHEHLEDLVNTLGRSSNRISFAMIIAALLIGSSLLVTQESGMVLGLVTYQTLGILGYLIAAVIGLWLLWSIYRSRHL